MTNHRRPHPPGEGRADPLQILRLFWRPVRELWDGWRKKTLPIAECCVAGITVLSLVYGHLDFRFWNQIGLSFFYPQRGAYRVVYVLTLAGTGFWFWGIYRAGLYHQFQRRLEDALVTAGLRNRLGRLPRLIGDWGVDKVTRKFRITNANLAREDFIKAKGGIEAGLKVFIDEIREDRQRGMIDVIYAAEPMPSTLAWNSIWIHPRKFVIGSTRSTNVNSNLVATPHLLVAGQTGGGKSTFLRQFITSLYVGSKDARFTLIDLKGGLEFQMFEKLERAHVSPDIGDAIRRLNQLERVMNDRMKLLRENGCKDVESLLGKQKSKLKPKLEIATEILVIDEASEMFLAGAHAAAKDIQNARRILSQIARQGRAVGVHLVIATQRPDTRALDPQVKANLTGVLCFQMANDASSMVVLGCGRATDLPSIPGRAIWKTGSGMVEVQTPYMSATVAEQILEPYRVEKAEPIAEGVYEASRNPIDEPA